MSVRFNTGAFADRRTQPLLDADCLNRFNVRVAVNPKQQRPPSMAVIGVDPHYIPLYIRAEAEAMPSILQRQAA